jgi:hypothetical protein
MLTLNSPTSSGRSVGIVQFAGGLRPRSFSFLVLDPLRCLEYPLARSGGFPARVCYRNVEHVTERGGNPNVMTLVNLFIFCVLPPIRIAQRIRYSFTNRISDVRNLPPFAELDTQEPVLGKRVRTLYQGWAQFH